MASITGTVLSLSGNSGYDNNGGDFDILRDLLITADAIAPAPFAGVGLVAALDTLPNLTVFAPDDDAFASLAGTIATVTGNATPVGEGATIGFLADALTLLGRGDASGVLTDILTYHVSGELVSSTRLVTEGQASTLFGQPIGLNASDLTLVDLDPGVPDPALDATQLDIGVDNGIIHVIEGVLLPAAVSAILTRPGTDFRIGDEGRDVIHTRGGDDFVDGNGGNDYVNAGNGHDVVIGGAGNDWLIGGRGNDLLIGEEGRDKLVGGGGHDTIEGGEGRDWMLGGGGNDTFVFTNGSDHDKIIRFQNNRDKIDLSGYEGIDDFHDIDIDIGFFSTTLNLGEGDSIKLVGTWWFQVDESDFIFEGDAIA